MFHIPHLFSATPKRLLSKKGNRILRQSLTHTQTRTICIVILMVSAFMALPALRRLLRRIMMERESEIRKINRKLIGLHCDCPLAVAFIAVPPLRRSPFGCCGTFYASFTLAMNCEKRVASGRREGRSRNEG